MDKCKTCKDKDTRGDEYPCNQCCGYDHYTENKPMTNADRIRSMSDEELIDLLTTWNYPFEVTKEYRDHIQELLKQEVE